MSLINTDSDPNVILLCLSFTSLYVMHLFLCHVLNITIFLQELDTLGWQEKWKGNKKIQQVLISFKSLFFSFLLFLRKLAFLAVYVI
jgi:hypothetical protein